ncbi:hypothetical protein WH96_04975 [Kiloniella spongiae]|uniref:Uncharacterized protein n=1 Tax=Kiloniella spongiae TaxID=1489064 RepID=A0A0H2MH18_9PROT|nr:hypothetical protein [Kiloniella spongiae]KLN61688.1 hypothetical protein WH96_04975 [Kiloniella spongiae]
MQGEIDQLLVLSSAANAMPLEKVVEVVTASPAPLKLPAAQAKRLRYAEDLSFSDLWERSDGTFKEQLRFTRLSDWLDDLRGRQVSAAWLDWQLQEQTDTATIDTDSDTHLEHMQVAFAGATKSWSLITTGPGFTEQWRANWQLDDRASEQTVWQVHYGCVQKSDQETPRPTISLAQTTARLEKILREISKLASRLGYDNWPAVFSKALDALEGKPGTALPPALRPPYYAVYPKEAHRLLAAAYSGWVFGGMGSWNDVVFSNLEDQAEYDRLTPTLYQSLCHAIVAVSCSFQK